MFALLLGLGDAGEAGEPAGGFEAEGDPLDDIESFEALAVLTQCVLIVAVLLLGWQIEKRRVSWLSEASVGLLVGVVVGAVAHFSTKSSAYSKWMSFDPDFFFFALLPPIIFEAGYSLDPKYFFGNFAAVCILAFLGTAVSAAIIAGVAWGAGRLGVSYPLTFLQAGLFGSLISATDPVTTLAVLGHAGADKNLYYIVFGESVLNDAVAIVMYQTLDGFQHTSFSSGSLWRAVGTFLLIFLGSCAIGGGTAFLSSLFYKFAGFKRRDYDFTEICLLVPLPIAAYMAAEGAKLSGIVSVLFCGVVMSRYTRRNLTQRSGKLSLSLFKVLGRLSETFVFIYMGSSLFLGHGRFGDWRMWSLFGLSFAAMLAARVCNVYPGLALANVFRRDKNSKIPMKQQHFVWFSGLRGAIAFALSMKSKEDVGVEAGETIFAVTLLVVIVTVAGFGGLTPTILSRLGLLSNTEPSADYDPVSRGEGSSAHLGRSDSEYDSGYDPGSRGKVVELGSMAKTTGEPQGEAWYDNGRGSPITPIKKLFRSASEKLRLEEIDRQLSNVLVTPDQEDSAAGEN